MRRSCYLSFPERIAYRRLEFYNVVSIMIYVKKYFCKHTLKVNNNLRILILATLLKNQARVIHSDFETSTHLICLHNLHFILVL